MRSSSRSITQDSATGASGAPVRRLAVTSLRWCSRASECGITDIDWLDGDLSTVTDSADSGDKRGKRGARKAGGSSERGRGRGGKRDTPIEEPVEALEASSDTVDEPVKAELADKPAETARRKPEPAKAAPRAQEASRRVPEPSRNGRNRGGNDHGNEPSPVGFGEDIPAFMLIRTAG